MASVEKFRLKDAPRLLSHCNRTQKNQGSHIDKNRSELNFDLAAGRHPGQTDYQFTKSRVNRDDITMMKREDVKAVCSWAISLPEELCHEEMQDDGTSFFAPNNEDECHDFFQYAYDFFKERHGEENIISANVHMDENKPHMHFIFTPVVEDKKDGHLKVCAKEALQGCYGAKMQIDIQDYISNRMGKELHMVKKETVDYERNVKELKKKTLNQKYAKLSREINKTEEQLQRKRAVLNAVTKAADAATVDIKISSSNGFTVMRNSDWEYVQSQLKLVKALKAERYAVLKEMKSLENKNLSLENDELKDRLGNVLKEINELKQENEKMKDFMNNTELSSGIKVADMYKNYEDEKERKEYLQKIFNEYGERER